MKKVDRAIETGDKTRALDAFIDHIQAGFDLQMAALTSDSDAAV